MICSAFNENPILAVVFIFMKNIVCFIYHTAVCVVFRMQAASEDEQEKSVAGISANLADPAFGQDRLLSFCPFPREEWAS